MGKTNKKNVKKWGDKIENSSKRLLVISEQDLSSWTQIKDKIRKELFLFLKSFVVQNGRSPSNRFPALISTILEIVDDQSSVKLKETSKAMSEIIVRPDSIGYKQRKFR